MTQLTIIVATDAKRGIGINNTLPWRLPEDMAHFKRLTSGHPIIMGRKTFDSIGRALPNRRNIVITRNRDWHCDGVEAAHSLTAAIALLGQTKQTGQTGQAEPDHAFIIGGAQIYAEAIHCADQIIVTEIAKTFACDAFFPEPDPATWQQSAREAYHSELNNFDYAFVTLRRKTTLVRA